MKHIAILSTLAVSLPALLEPVAAQEKTLTGERTTVVAHRGASGYPPSTPSRATSSPSRWAPTSSNPISW